VEQARQELAPGVERSLRHERTRFNYAYFVRPGDTTDKLSFDYLVDTGYYFIGDPDTVYEGLKNLYDETGGFGVLMLVMGHPEGGREGHLRTLRMFMEDVAPRLKELERARGYVTDGAVPA
jgi:alkanesulfonate monooxygenase SsuD/methylene tetrahydromethanopterin reductase-like flavin-dependent oxidoreductase (luciferase family)